MKQDWWIDPTIPPTNNDDIGTRDTMHVGHHDWILPRKRLIVECPSHGMF